MNRSQLFSESWSIMIHNRALWIVALIGAALNVIVGLFVLPLDIASSLFTTFVSLVTTAFVSGALIHMINLIADGQSATANDGIQAGMRTIFPLTLIQLLLSIPAWIIAFLLTGSILSAFSGTFAQPNTLQGANISNVVGSALGIAIASILVSFILSSIGAGADRGVVLENRSVFGALGRGWQLLAGHLADFVVINLIAFIIALAIGIVYSCAIGPILSAAIRTGSSINPASLITNPAYIVFLIFTLLTGVLLGVLLSGVWTLAFRQWQGK